MKVPFTKQFLVIVCLIVLTSIQLRGQEGTNSVEATYKKANTAVKEKHYQDAISLYSKVIQQDPRHVSAYEMRAAAHHKLDQFKQAIADATAAIQLTSTHPFCYALRGAAHQGLNEFDLAIADFSKALTLLDDQATSNASIRAEIILSRAQAFISKLDYLQAVSDYSSVITVSPTNVTALLGRGRAYVSLKEYPEAVSDFRNVISHAPAFSAVYFEFGNALAHLGQRAEAITNYTYAIKLDPRNGSAFSNRGLLHAHEGQFETALADCKKGVELSPESAHCLNNLAWLLSVLPSEQLRDGKRALELAQKACKLANWEHPYYLGTLAAAYAETGDFRSAIEFQKKSLKLGFPEAEAKEAQQCLDLYEQGMPFRLTAPKK